ncbi:MAG TPA: RAMP superfamily CRISPR-associated protein, partial [Azospirillaceae bacterium]|nr:RAMP superfamily CRISPR-associated protein [Azospirillaceae bacterium]
MAREIAERWIVQGTLRTMTPLHVGGLGADPDTDLPLARDGAGGWHVPGTSLAGAFRAWWTRSFGPEETDRLWGKVPTRGGGRWDGWASHIQIEDAPIVVPGGAPELRDGVGIDRLSGAAAARIKYDRAMLPAGSTLGLAMSIDVAKKQDAAQAEAMLGHFLDALIAGRIHLGAATNRGLGRLALLHAGEDGGPRILRQTLNQRSGMLEALRTGGGSKALEELNRTAATPHPARRLTVELQWESLGPVMTRASLEGLAVDSWPLVGRDGDQVRLLLSGAGVKGV